MLIRPITAISCKAIPVCLNVELNTGKRQKKKRRTSTDLNLNFVQNLKLYKQLSIDQVQVFQNQNRSEYTE